MTRRALSWAAVTLGIIIGLCGIVIAGQSSIEREPDSSVWQVFGVCLLGLIFLVGSFAALRSQRHAGLLFIAAAPIVAFILAYPAAGFWVTQPNGDVDYILPTLPPAIVLSCVFFAPFLVPLLAIRTGNVPRISSRVWHPS